MSSSKRGASSSGKGKRKLTQEEEFELLEQQASREILEEQEEAAARAADATNMEEDNDDDDGASEDAEQASKKRKKKKKKNKAAQEKEDNNNHDQKKTPSKRAKAAAVAFDSDDDSEADEPPKKRAATASSSARKKSVAATPDRRARGGRPRNKDPGTTTSPKRSTTKAAGPTTSSRTPQRAPPTASLLDTPSHHDNDTKAQPTKVGFVGTPEDDTTHDMPLPPPITQLQRTQSTPLELELEHQVVANAQADRDAQPLPFTKAPPDHLLQFAPKEPEEGYDLPENNDGEAWVDHGATAAEPQHARRRGPVLPSLGVSLILESLVIGGWFYFFYVRQGAYYQQFFRTHMAKIPFKSNPYRTSNGRVVPILPCFVTNVDDPPVHYRQECRNEALTFSACPAFGDCYGGSLQACKEPYLERSQTGTKCVMKAPVFEIYEHVLRQVEAWTLDHSCQALASNKNRETDDGDATAEHKKTSRLLTYDDKYSVVDDDDDDDNDNAAPKPYMFVTMKDTTPWTKQPMFAMDYLLDAEPFLLAPLAQELQLGTVPPVDALYALLEATNPLRHQLKLQILTRYGVDTATPDNTIAGAEEPGEEDEGEGSAPQQQPVDHLHLVALVPSMQAWWRRELLSLERQCQLRDYQTRFESFYEDTMESPWLVYCWAISMALVGVWLVFLQYFLKKAHEQQEFLQQVQDVHKFVLATLEETKPKTWEGRELKEHALKACTAVSRVNKDQFYKRLWPRVVFESRTDQNVSKTVIVKGGDLVDVWAWEPSPEQ